MPSVHSPERKAIRLFLLRSVKSVTRQRIENAVKFDDTRRFRIQRVERRFRSHLTLRFGQGVQHHRFSRPENRIGEKEKKRRDEIRRWSNDHRRMSRRHRFVELNDFGNLLRNER